MLDRLVDKNNLHHAYLIEGEGEYVKPPLFALLKDIGIETEGNPDVIVQYFESFGIEEARELKESHIQKEVGDSKKIYILEVGFFTYEAQNALLKIFEEPVVNVYFFIITNRADHLIPTLQSRLNIIRLHSVEATEDQRENAKRFINGSVEERIGFVENFLSAFEDESSVYIKQSTLSFLNDLEREYACDKKNLPNHKDAIQSIWNCRKYMIGRGSSVKMLLENLAHVI